MRRTRMRAQLDRVWRLRKRPPGEVMQFIARRGSRRLRSEIERAIGRPLTQRVNIPALLQAVDGVGRLPENEALRALHVQFRDEVTPLLPVASYAAFGAQFTAAYPEEARRLVARAENAVAHRFDLLGTGPVTYGPRIAWHTDVVAGKTWPVRSSGTLDILGLGEAFDVKRPWEVARQQYLPTLAHAYRVTGEERYAEEAVAGMLDWIRANPPGAGIHWIVPMELSLRICSWGLTLDHLRSSSSLTPSALTTILGSVLSQARYIMTNQEKAPLAGNHYVANGFGLAVAGLAFPLFREAGRWLQEGLRILDSEIMRQVYPDGVDYEQSTNYHRFVGEMCALTLLFLQVHGRPFPTNIPRRLERMLEFSRDMTAPDGLTPALADADDGFVVRLTERVAEDHRLFLAEGVVLFGCGDLRAVAGAYPADLWLLLGEAGRTAYDSAPGTPAPGRSRAYPDGGYFCLRDGREKDDFFSVIDCGHLGMGPGQYGGHGHADTLSVICSALGTPLLVDPGTYTYTGSVEWRNQFRSTAGHNALVVDGEDVAELGAPWSMINRCWPTVRGWAVGEAFTVFEGSHSGYERLSDPVTHRRRLVLRHGRYWLILDTVHGKGTHEVQRFFHLPPSAVAEVNRGEVRATIPSDGGAISLAIILPASIGQEGSVGVPKVTMEEGWHSPRYGVREPSSVVRVCQRIAMPGLLCTLLAPSRSAGEPVALDVSVQAEGLQLAVRVGKTSDVWKMAGDPWDAAGPTGAWELCSGNQRERLTP